MLLMLVPMCELPGLCLQIIDFLESVAKEHGHLTGVANLIGNMCIKPAHLTSDEEVSSIAACTLIMLISHTIVVAALIACNSNLVLCFTENEMLSGVSVMLCKTMLVHRRSPLVHNTHKQSMI